MNQKEIQNYVNQNIHLIKNFEFFIGYVAINFLDGTCVDIEVSDAGTIDLTKY